MTDPKQPPKDDITQQSYKGPSMLSASLGEGALQTKFYLGVGAILGAALAGFRPDKAKETIAAMDSVLTKARNSQYAVARLFAAFSDVFFNLGKELAEWTTSVKWIKSRLDKLGKSTQVVMAVEGAVYGSTILSFLGGLVGSGVGARKSHLGRKQFENAKAEITSLRGKLVDKQTELEDTKTSHAAQEGVLKVAQDEPPSLEDTDRSPSPAISQLTEKPQTQWVDTVASQKSAAPEASLT